MGPNSLASGRDDGEEPALPRLFTRLLALARRSCRISGSWANRRGQKKTHPRSGRGWVRVFAAGAGFDACGPPAPLCPCGRGAGVKGRDSIRARVACLAPLCRKGRGEEDTYCFFFADLIWLRRYSRAMSSCRSVKALADGAFPGRWM